MGVPPTSAGRRAQRRRRHRQHLDALRQRRHDACNQQQESGEQTQRGLPVYIGRDRSEDRRRAAASVLIYVSISKLLDGGVVERVGNSASLVLPGRRIPDRRGVGPLAGLERDLLPRALVRFPDTVPGTGLILSFRVALADNRLTNESKAIAEVFRRESDQGRDRKPPNRAAGDSGVLGAWHEEFGLDEQNHQCAE